MNTLGTKFLFPGEVRQSRTSAWLTQRLVAIRECMDDGLPEAALTLLYSAIDALGVLNAVAGTTDASRSTFLDWCAQYIVPRLSTTGEAAPTATDLYAARCGVLHSSSAESRLGREGHVPELWYTFRGRAAANLALNAPKPPLLVEIERLVGAFEEGSRAFVAELSRDQDRFAIAEGRAARFFCWSTAEQT
jgi:hypothetical protein